MEGLGEAVALGCRPQSCGPEAGIQMSLPPVLIQDPPKSESARGSPRRFSFCVSGNPFMLTDSGLERPAATRRGGAG